MNFKKAISTIQEGERATRPENTSSAILDEYVVKRVAVVCPALDEENEEDMEDKSFKKWGRKNAEEFTNDFLLTSNANGAHEECTKDWKHIIVYLIAKKRKIISI